MNKDVKRFLKNLLLVIVILFVIDRGIGYLLGYFFEKQPNGIGDTSVTTYAVEKSKEDVLIFGTSRASHHYDSRIISDTLGLSTFNCGRNGTNIIYHAAILPVMLERHTPKFVILDVTVNELSKESTVSNDALTTMLLPYMNKHKEIEEIIKKIDPFQAYKAKISKIYPYNSLPMSIILPYAHFGYKNINGYQPLRGSKVTGTYRIVKDEGLNVYAKERLIFFINEVRSRGIPLIAVLSPLYTPSYKETTSIIEIKKILKDYNMQLWDYSTNPAFIHPQLFYDNSHMNKDGATLFSDSIASRIKAIYLTKTSH